MRTESPSTTSAAEDFEAMFQEKVLSPADAARYAAQTPLRAFYDEWLAQEHRSRVDAGKLARATREKYIQALAAWERYAPRPEDWPAQKPWPGLPIASCTDKYVSQFLDAIAAKKSPHYARGLWGHLRAVFNRAVKVRAIDRCPKPEPLKSTDTGVKVEIYADNQLAPIYRAFSIDLQLQTAFVCGINFGPRTEDLFALTWDCFDFESDPPTVTYTATKTGKRQAVPLAEAMVGQLKRLAKGRLLKIGPLFGDLTSLAAKVPEKSRPARRRNQRAKKLLGELGIEVEKPWQVARATCGTRYTRYSSFAIAQFILGHELSGVTARHYWEPTEAVREAVRELPQDWLAAED